MADMAGADPLARAPHVRLLGGHEEKGNQGGVPADSGLHREGGIAAGGGVMGSGGGGVRWVGDRGGE
jgi:hypothetical protein